MTKAEIQAIWDRVNDDRRVHKQWAGVDFVAMSSVSPLVRSPLDDPEHPQDEYLRLFGIKVVIDPSLPPSEIRLRSATGEIRVVNLDPGGAAVSESLIVIPGTPRKPAFNILPPPYYKKIDAPQRTQFGYHSDRVTIEGTCDSTQDLRDVLREMLAILEAQ